MLKKATKAGVISAKTFEDPCSYDTLGIDYGSTAGITLGIYGKSSCVSLEGKDDGVYLLINDEAIKELGIKVCHTNRYFAIKR